MSKNSISAELVGHNIDLVEQILLFLPAKSLVHCGLVSKTWHALASDHEFAVLWQQRRLPSGLICHLAPRNYTYIRLLDCQLESESSNKPFEFGKPEKILHSCNGLLLCEKKYLENREYDKYGYMVYNPTTKQSAFVPQFCQLDEVASINIAYDPSESSDCKVIGLRRSKYVRSYQIYMYSSSYTRYWRCWKPIDYFEMSNDSILHDSVFWNNYIVWLWSDKTLCFDVDQEDMFVLPSPSNGKEMHSYYFGESRGHLHFILLDGCSSIRFDVHEMKSDCLKWFLKHSVDLSQVSRSVCKKRCNGLYYSLLSLIQGENEEDLVLVLNLERQIISYRTDCNKVSYLNKESVNSVLLRYANGHRSAHHHIESIFGFQV
ncbi:F-box protein [Abeliophyllum distichum]|uniref:F-box protein n=1 Tax=Abeliophyllum distichum TaxID=126358 RepID=A0ABD1UJW0_9LAMI